MRTDKGICFQSRRGIELLDHGMNVKLVSDGVDAIIREQYPEVIATGWDPENQIARFVVSNRNNGYLILCWHTLFELWTTASVPLCSHTNGMPTVPAGLVRAFGRNYMGLTYYADVPTAPPYALAREYRYDANAHYCDGRIESPASYQSIIEAANVKLDGLLGFQRIWRADVLLRDRSANCGVQINYAIDYAASASSVDRVWSSAIDLESGATDSPDHWRYQVHIEHQKCTAFRLIVRDQPLIPETGDPSPDYHFTMIGFGLEWGRRPGARRGAERSKK